MKPTKRNTAQPVAVASTNAAPVTQPVAPLSIAQLTPEQLKQLRVELRQQTIARTGDVDKRNTLIDSKLREKDGDGWKWTTAEILAALVDTKILPTMPTGDNRAAALKMIQTRKQFLEKVPANKGLVGFKPTASGIGALTIERAIQFLKEQGFTVTKA